MTARIIEIKDLASAVKEITSVGADPAGIKIMAPKAVSHAILVKKIRSTAANIIKQEMLALGGEAATAYSAINHSAKTSDVLILGNLQQFNFLVKKLKVHQFGLPEAAREIEKVIDNYRRTSGMFCVGKKKFVLGKRTLIMGILNVTPDSFSDGGKYSSRGEAVSRAKEMAEEGADIIDIGGESTRPGARAVPAGEEMRRVIPVIRELSRDGKIIISIDTRKAAVARAALEAGAHMVNDVSGLRHDRGMAGVVARCKVPVCLMHMQGVPRTMQKKPAYFDLMGEVIGCLEESIAFAINAGILHEKIIIDPGIGFGKTVAHNLEILKRLRELRVLGCPVLVGPSRKSLIGEVLGLPVGERVEGTAALVAAAIANGADLVRVHDVKKMFRVARMADAIFRRA
jgi:dihydropteroate synthase